MTPEELGLIDANDWGVLHDYYLDNGGNAELTLFPEWAIERLLHYSGLGPRKFAWDVRVSGIYMKGTFYEAKLRNCERIFAVNEVLLEGNVYVSSKRIVCTRKTMFLALLELPCKLWL